MNYRYINLAPPTQSDRFHRPLTLYLLSITLYLLSITFTYCPYPLPIVHTLYLLPIVQHPLPIVHHPLPIVDQPLPIL